MKVYGDMLRGARTKKIVLPQPPKEADDDGSQGRHRSAKNGTSLTAFNKGGIVGRIAARICVSHGQLPQPLARWHSRGHGLEDVGGADGACD